MKTNLLEIAIFGIEENSFKNLKSGNIEQFLNKIGKLKSLIKKIFFHIKIFIFSESIKNAENARCISCYNAAYACYYSSGSWFNSECTNAYNVCYSCGVSLASALAWFGK